MQERERVRCSSCHVLPRPAPKRVPGVSRSGSSAGARNAFGEQLAGLSCLPASYRFQLLTPCIVVHSATRLHRRALPVLPRDPLAALQAFDFAQGDGGWTLLGIGSDMGGLQTTGALGIFVGVLLGELQRLEGAGARR